MKQVEVLKLFIESGFDTHFKKDNYPYEPFCNWRFWNAYNKKGKYFWIESNADDAISVLFIPWARYEKQFTFVSLGALQAHFVED